MLLASAPRSTRARWLGVSTLVLAMALTAPATVHGQDGTVYIGGGSNSQTGTRGVQGSDNVIVNLDAIDGGRGRADTRSRSGGGDAGGNQPSVEFGEPYRGPAGAMLRFPPERPPQSHMVVDPDQPPDNRQASRDTQQTDPAPGRKPEQRQPQDAGEDQDRQRTAAATPATKPNAPGPNETRQSDSSADLPEAPSFDDGGASRGETRTNGQSQPDTSMRDNGDQPAPTELTVRPTRKPEPPQATRTAERQDTQAPETATTSEPAQPTESADEPTSDAAPTASEPEPAPQSSPETTQTAASDPESATQPADSSGGQTSEAEAPATPDSADADTQQTATRTEPAGDEASDSSATESSGTDATGADASGETQTASLPPEALPEQMRLMFEDGSAGLSDSAKSQLEQLAQVLEENPQQRVQLMAFAQGTEDTASQARRLSLSRALAVRTYLIDQGIRSTRMDVRALGATADQGPLDRVDIVPANR